MPDYDHMRDGWNGHMGNGSAWTPWLVILLVATTLLLVAAGLLAARLYSSRRPTGLAGGRLAQGTAPPEEMLDRLFATGEIDEATYRARRTALAEMRQPARP